MRIVSPAKIIAAKLEPHESLFVGLWHSMTHNKSLDSYRVRCMNSRTIVREISQECRLNLMATAELGQLCMEAKSILEQDPVCGKYFSGSLKTLLPFLIKVPPIDRADVKKKQVEDEKGFREFTLVVNDFYVGLERSYFGYLCDYLQSAIKPDNDEEIKLVTSYLLSDLVDQGWPLETLFSWPEKYLEAPPTHTFVDNLKFMLKVLNYPSQEYKIILKISQSSVLPTIGLHGEFAFSSNCSVNASAQASIARFAKSSQSVCFAETTRIDFDFKAAVINARNDLDKLIDLLRFGFELDKLTIDNVCYVKRLSDSKEEIIVVQHILPNPTDDIKKMNFPSFSGDLNAIADKNGIQNQSKRQLHAAIRQYRFGRDVDNYEDKFLYWWMGLEALARNETGEIGAAVTHNVSRCMALIYIPRLLDDFIETLKYCRIDWPGRLVECCGNRTLSSLTVDQLMTIIQSQETREILLSLCAPYPVISYYGKHLMECLADPKKTAQLLNEHLNHLEWHLLRLYQIRCCIVHGSEIRYRLGLLTANLEYYLRQVILITVTTFREFDHIASLEELFIRASVVYNNLISKLQCDDASQDTIRETISSCVLLTGIDG